MWFLIRAAFWLAIVFAALPWPDGSAVSFSPPVAMWSRTRDAIGAALGKARAEGEKICMNAPVPCLKAAARIEGIIVEKKEPPANAAPPLAPKADEPKTQANAQQKRSPAPVKVQAAAGSSPQLH
jgi:hypothetical protein